MTARKAFSQAVSVWKNKPGETFSFMLLEVVLRLAVLCPLLALASPAVRWLALLSPVLYLLLILPARQSAAGVMQDALRGRTLFTVRLLIAPGYWGRVGKGLLQMLVMLPWFLPCIGATAYLLWVYTGAVDAFTALRMVSNLGGGDIVIGAVIVAVVYVCTFIPALVGLAFHSGRRHEIALGSRVIAGHRGLVIRSWFMGLITLLPFAIAAAFICAEYAMRLMAAAKEFMDTFSLNIPPLDQNAWLLLVAAVLLLLPFLPLKSFITAAAVHGLWEEKDS